MADIARALVAAGQRNASVRAADAGNTYSAATLADAEALLHGLADAEKARKRGQTQAGRTATAQARSERAEKRRRAKLDAARVLWVGDEFTIDGIADRVGLSLRGLQQHLGPRSDARAKAARRKPLA